MIATRRELAHGDIQRLAHDRSPIVLGQVAPTPTCQPISSPHWPAISRRVRRALSLRQDLAPAVAAHRRRDASPLVAEMFNTPRSVSGPNLRVDADSPVLEPGVRTQLREQLRDRLSLYHGARIMRGEAQLVATISSGSDQWALPVHVPQNDPPFMASLSSMTDCPWRRVEEYAEPIPDIHGDDASISQLMLAIVERHFPLQPPETLSVLAVE